MNVQDIVQPWPQAHASKKKKRTRQKNKKKKRSAPTARSRGKEKIDFFFFERSSERECRAVARRFPPQLPSPSVRRPYGNSDELARLNPWRERRAQVQPRHADPAAPARLHRRARLSATPLPVRGRATAWRERRARTGRVTAARQLPVGGATAPTTRPRAGPAHKSPRPSPRAPAILHPRSRSTGPAGTRPAPRSARPRLRLRLQLRDLRVSLLTPYSRNRPV